MFFNQTVFRIAADFNLKSKSFPQSSVMGNLNTPSLSADLLRRPRADSRGDPVYEDNTIHKIFDHDYFQSNIRTVGNVHRISAAIYSVRRGMPWPVVWNRVFTSSWRKCVSYWVYEIAVAWKRIQEFLRAYRKWIGPMDQSFVGKAYGLDGGTVHMTNIRTDIRKMSSVEFSCHQLRLYITLSLWLKTCANPITEWS